MPVAIRIGIGRDGAVGSGGPAPSGVPAWVGDCSGGAQVVGMDVVDLHILHGIDGGEPNGIGHGHARALGGESDVAVVVMGVGAESMGVP